MNLVSATLAFSVLVCNALPASAQSVNPLTVLTPAEFLKLPDVVRSVYVGGVLDGMTFVTYGYGIALHDRFVLCARSIAPGELAERTAQWLKARPTFGEGGASAVARTFGAYCKEKGLD